MALFTWRDHVSNAFIGDGSERTAGGNQRPAIGPGNQIGRVRFALAGGLESAKMIGRSVCAAISLTIASVKLPAAVEAPISMVGFTRRTTSARPIPLSVAVVHPAFAFGGGRAYGG